MQFQTSPAEKAVEVTAMAFDGPKRRLITGSKDGALRLWNFNNGALLATLPAQDDSEVIFLCSRERNPDTAILLSSAADGFVYAWSTHHQGGLLGKFCAVHLEDTAVISMATDQQDQVLFTGDSAGYITLWDIERYSVCMPRDEEGMTPQQKAVHLRSLIPAYCKVTGPRRVNTEARTEVRPERRHSLDHTAKEERGGHNPVHHGVFMFRRWAAGASA
uniref:WD repeat-containing protein on Y chromosome n=1 Tax=Esox lucius TaxID=8010 RepID=A0AAY5L9V8_ESOLU